MVVVWTLIDNWKSDEPWWDVASDMVLLPLGGIGILLFLLSVDGALVKSAWKVVAVLVVVGQLLTNVVHRHLTLSSKTKLSPERVSEWVILGADLTAVVLLAPMFAMNLIYAFS